MQINVHVSYNNKEKIDDCIDGTISRIRHDSMYICVSKWWSSMTVCHGIMSVSPYYILLPSMPSCDNTVQYTNRVLSIYDLTCYKFKIFIKNRST